MPPFAWRASSTCCAAPVLGFDPDELADAARPYATSVATHPVGSREEIDAMFAAAGLRPCGSTSSTCRGTVAPSQAGPGTMQPATYARIVAARG